jgi:hypothetical protein
LLIHRNGADAARRLSSRALPKADQKHAGQAGEQGHQLTIQTIHFLPPKKYLRKLFYEPDNRAFEKSVIPRLMKCGL